MPIYLAKCPGAYPTGCIVKRAKQKDKSFYSLVGPYLADRRVAKEIGYHIYDDDRTLWVLDTSRNHLRGFALFRVVGVSATITACYTIEKYRMSGVMKRVIEFGIENVGAELYRASANGNSARLFQSIGFKHVRTNGRFDVMEYRSA